MTVSPEALLESPRGRGLLVHLLDDAEVRGLIHRADHFASSGSGWAMLAYSPAPAPGLSGLVDRVRLKRERTRREREMRTPVTPTELAEAIRRAVPHVTDDALVEALVRTVDDSRPYQPPDGNEAVVADPAVREALLPIAARVAKCDLAGLWGAADRDQWAVVHHDSGELPAQPRDTRVVLATWRQTMIAAEKSARSTGTGGMWWSRPPHELSSTTSEWPGLGPVALYLEEDGRDPVKATATPVGHVPSRTFEITDADAWAHLCRKYPLDITHAVGATWNESLGCADSWVIPDWNAVAADWDAVHLTVAGYLEAATRPISVRDGVATAIAGWSPDETVWLAADPQPAGAAVTWQRYDHLGWRAAPSGPV